MLLPCPSPRVLPNYPCKIWLPSCPSAMHAKKRHMSELIIVQLIDWSSAVAQVFWFKARSDCVLKFLTVSKRSFSLAILVLASLLHEKKEVLSKTFCGNFTKTAKGHKHVSTCCLADKILLVRLPKVLLICLRLSLSTGTSTVSSFPLFTHTVWND